MSLVPHDSCRGVQHALPMPPDAPSMSLPKIAAFTFLVRDAEDFLEANGRAVSSIGRTHFREHRLFYVENDSADGTRAILRRLERELPLSGVMLNVSAERSTALAGPEQMNCAARRAARAAARALELALAWPAWDVLVGVDLDFKRVSADDFVRTVALGARLGAAAVFGMSVFNGSRGVVMPYDQGAVLPKEALRSISLGCLTSVRSAFSGFAAYFAAPLRRARGTTPLPPPTPTPPRPSTRASTSRSTPPAPARSSSTRASSRSTSGATDIFGRASAPPTPRPRGRGRRGERPRGVC